MAKPGSGRRKTNAADDYRVQVIDRRAKYQADTEQILSKGLSKAELDKALTTLRKEFIRDLQNLTDKATQTAVDRFFSRYDKRNKNNGPNSNEVTKAITQAINSGNKESSKSSAATNEALGNIINQFKGTNNNYATLNSGLMQNMQSFSGKFSNFISSFSNSLSSFKSMLGGATYSGGVGGVLGILYKIYTVAGEIASGMNNLFVDSINKSIELQSSMMGKINTRLYGLTEQFDVGTEKDHNYYGEIIDDVTGKFLRSSYVNQSKLLENIQSLVGEGIGFNIEERAYIQTIADKLVDGFKVTESNLVKAIRLNQFDLTQAQLGTQSLINQFLNANYQDTSYMNSMYTSVYGNIQDALSQMNYGDATEFNYNVQKWLGSLYSVGVSENLITSLASGINMLATGDVGGLEGNTQLQNLLVMGATKAGLSYSQMLTEGLDSSQLNTLLGSVVSYLQDIADNTNNEVVKNAYKSIVGVGVSDLRAIQNLTDDEISSLAVTTQTFQDAINEATNQVAIFEGSNGSSNRIGVAERISNQMNNLLYSVGQQLVNNPKNYEIYRKSQMVQSIIDSLAPSLGLVGDIVQAISGPANALIQNEAIMEAFNDAMSAAGYGEYDPGALANTITTNVGQTVTVDDDGNVSVVSYEDLATAIAAIQDNDAYTALYGSDTSTFATRYATDEDALNAINYAAQHGYRMVAVEDLNTAEHGDLGLISPSGDAEGQFTLDDNGVYVSNLTGIIQDGTEWAWVKTDGQTVAHEDLSGLIDGSVVGAREAARTAEQYGGADLDQAANNIANAEPTYGWESLIAMLLSSGWDPIDNGMGIDPFGKGYYTKRGEYLYGLNSNGTLNTANVVGTTSNTIGVTGLTAAQQAATVATTPTVVSGGISYSSQLTTNTNQAIASLSSNQAAVQAQVQTVASVQEDTSKTVESMYTALFVDGLAVNVNVSQLSEAVVTKIAEVLETNSSPKFKALSEKLESTFKVEVANQNSVYQALAATKEW